MQSTSIIALSLVVAAPTWAAPFQRTIPAQGVEQLTLGFLAADMAITGTSANDVELEANREVPIEVEGSNMTIGSYKNGNPPPPEHAGKNDEVGRVILRIPAALDLVIRTVAGDLRLSNIRGRVRANLVSGDVVVRDCVGAIEVHAVSGDLDVQGLAADLTAQTVSGDIRVLGFDGLLLETKSVSGDITVRKSKTRTARASSHSGDILFSGASPTDGSVELTSFSGNAVIELPKDGGFELEATTFSGSVNLDVEAETMERSTHRLRARTRKAGPRLRLKSHSGDISVR